MPTFAPTLFFVYQAWEERRPSYTTDLCVSVIAIAHSVDPRYLHEGEEADIFGEGEHFVCELGTGVAVPIKGTDEQIQSMRGMLADGTLVSAETTIGIADDLMPEPGDNSVYLPPGEIVVAPRNDDGRKKQWNRSMLKGGSPEAQNMDDAADDNQRQLSRYEGNKPFLVVRVTDSDGNVHPDDAFVMSDKVFGTGGDVSNAKTQFAKCSHGRFQVTNDYSEDISRHLSAPGVIDVTIPISLKGNDRSTIRNELIGATQAKLGFGLPGPFEHVMFVLEQCYTGCGWAAYAYVNSWLSVYQGDNYKFVAVQVHEIGHNLNFVSDEISMH